MSVSGLLLLASIASARAAEVQDWRKDDRSAHRWQTDLPHEIREALREARSAAREARREAQREARRARGDALREAQRLRREVHRSQEGRQGHEGHRDHFHWRD
jgi:hypothetical protein